MRRIVLPQLGQDDALRCVNHLASEPPRRVGLDDKGDAYPRQLFDGQQHRVAAPAGWRCTPS
jgi:ABC-type polar amino acid transport system ATPase subunit